MLSEVNHLKKDKHCTISLTYGYQGLWGKRYEEVLDKEYDVSIRQDK
jgi:hypothetical protein